MLLDFKNNALFQGLTNFYVKPEIISWVSQNKMASLTAAVSI